LAWAGGRCVQGEYELKVLRPERCGVTLILTFGTPDYVLILADRRLSASGKPVDDEAGKAAILTCANGRFGYAFSGLAGAQGFQTYEWMIGTLADIGRSEFGATAVVRGLKDKLDQKFSSKQMLQLSRASRRLSIVFTGYIYERAAHPILAWAVLSNFRHPKTGVESALAEPTFHAGFGQANPSNPVRSIHLRLGAWPPVAPKDWQALISLARARKPVEAVIGKGVEMFRELAKRPSSGNTVGHQITSVIISPDPSKNPEAGYHTATNATTVYFPGEVYCLPQLPGLAHAGISISLAGTAAGPPGVVATAPARRNAQCPCGSGKKYRLCHGKLRPHMR
jgi:SEC-C motif-containing protein